jgi:hypothetical protein
MLRRHRYHRLRGDVTEWRVERGVSGVSFGGGDARDTLCVPPVSRLWRSSISEQAGRRLIVGARRRRRNRLGCHARGAGCRA